jgi:phage terminase large subunit-like protein
VDQIHQVIESNNKRQLYTLLQEQKRRRGLNDLHFLCKQILKYQDLTEEDGFHGDYCKHLQDESKNFKLTLSPRGSLKSSIGTIGGSIRDIIRNPNVRILLASENFAISVKFLSEIKGHLEKNDEFINLYGNLRGKDTWAKHEITVKTRTSWKASPTIACAGIDVTKVGMHYDVIRVDDPHSDQNTTSQDQIDKVIRWYKLLLSLLDPGGYLYITGTIWHYGDLYNYIINKERERVEAGFKKRFKIFKRDSFIGTTEELVNDKITSDKCLWPERLGPEFLKEQYLEQGPYIFSCQYRLNPIDDENAIFKRSWLKTYYPDELPKNVTVYSTIDPMRNEEGTDWLSIVTGAMDENWIFYLLDIRRIKADEHDTVEEMYSVYNNYKPLKMGIETVAWQESFYKYVTMLQIMRGKRLPVSELKTDTRVTKRLRIKSMVPYFKAGLYKIPSLDGTVDNLKGNMAILVDELTRYPKTTNDDCVDALAYMNQLTRRPGVIKILKRLHPGSFNAIRAKVKLSKKAKGKIGSTNIRRLASA